MALTGAGSNERLAAAMGLLEDGYGRRVLVSGVNREASREDIRNVSRAVRRLYDCCVDLGFTAADTVGNARETADWAQAMRYRSLIVVTADYHMPRAMLELNAVLRGAGVSAQTYAVATPSLKSRDWWRSPGAARLMVVEYCKYLAILGREAVLGLGPREAPAAQQKASTVIAVRSLVYVALFYLWTALCRGRLHADPARARPRWTHGMFHFWGRGRDRLLRDLRHQGRGARPRAHPHRRRPSSRPSTSACSTSSPSSPGCRASVFVMKKELAWIPWFGWYARKAGSDRHRPRGRTPRRCARWSARATTASPKGRQVVIFPEGTRKAPGAPPDYKPGIAALYRELDVPVLSGGHQRRRPLARPRLHPQARDHRLRVPRAHPAGPQARGVHAAAGGADRDRQSTGADWRSSRPRQLPRLHQPQQPLHAGVAHPHLAQVLHQVAQVVDVAARQARSRRRSARPAAPG